TNRGAKPEPMETARTNGRAKTSPKDNSDDSAPVVRAAKTGSAVLDAGTRSAAAAKLGTPTSQTAEVAPTTVSSPAAAMPEPSAGKLTRAKTTKGSAKPDLVQPATAPQPTRDGQSTLTRTLGLKIGRIVIDAGHGGHDTGTIGPTGLMEKDLCLDVALRLGKIIQQKLPGADIVYTRSDDTFIPLE